MNGSWDPFFIINGMKSNTGNLFCFIELLIVDGLEFRLSGIKLKSKYQILMKDIDSFLVNFCEVIE